MSSTNNLIGAIVSVVGSVLSNVGINVQKLAHNQNAKLPLAERKAYTMIPLWWCGLLNVIGACVRPPHQKNMNANALVQRLYCGMRVCMVECLYGHSCKLNRDFLQLVR
jgi:hypothetical protein